MIALDIFGGGIMTGWILSLMTWFVIVAAIYFTGHINIVKVEQHYRAFQAAMHTVHAQQLIEADCQWTQVQGSVLPYEHCVRSHWDALAVADVRKEHLEDLAISSERLARAELDYRQLGLGQRAFEPFLKILPNELQLRKRLVVLAQDGSSPHLQHMQNRLQKSQKTWGGVLRDAKQSFKEYESYVEQTDGPWRSIDPAQWLEQWRAESPFNYLEQIP